MTRRPLTRLQRRRRLERAIDALIVLGSVAAVLIGLGVLLESTAAAERAVARAEATLTASRAVTASLAPDGPQAEPAPSPAPSPAPEAADPDIPLSAELQGVLAEACEAYGVDQSLALGLIETESRFDPEADNGLCYGLCQLNRDYFPDNLSPADNLRAGLEYLGSLLDRYESVAAALTAYNAGHDTGRRGYADAVLSAASQWEAALGQ